MKKFFTLLVSATLLAAPIAQAQDYRQGRPPVANPGQQVERNIRNERPGPSRAEQRRPARADDRRQVRQPRWARGQRLGQTERRRAAEIRDHRRYGLRAPARGQRWVRVDDQYLLIGIATGVISAIVASGR